MVLWPWWDLKHRHLHNLKCLGIGLRASRIGFAQILKPLTCFVQLVYNHFGKAHIKTFSPIEMLCSFKKNVHIGPAAVELHRTLVLYPLGELTHRQILLHWSLKQGTHIIHETIGLFLINDLKHWKSSPVGSCTFWNASTLTHKVQEQPSNRSWSHWSASHNGYVATWESAPIGIYTIWNASTLAWEFHKLHSHKSWSHRLASHSWSAATVRSHM